MVIPPKDIDNRSKNGDTLSVEKNNLEKTVGTVETVNQGTGNNFPGVSTSCAKTIVNAQFDYERMIRNLIGDCGVVLGKNGKVYLQWNDMGNHYHDKVGSNFTNLHLRRQALKEGITLRDKDLKEINDMIRAYAEMEMKPVDTYLRVAPFLGGIEIDLGDDAHTRVRITPGTVELVEEGSEIVFYRSNITLSFDKPARNGDIKLIKKYLNNIKAEQQILIIAWISYTLAHPKVSTTKFVHLVLLGSQGSGKSFLCRLIQRLIDPAAVGLQVLPRNTKDLIVAAQNAHLLLFDNVRKLTQAKSDDLCVAGTGGALSTKKLYTDDDQSVSYLHVPLILNGIFDFVTESDLASRSLIVYLQDMDESLRLSEVTLDSDLEKDMPVMLSGLFQLIADIFKVLPETKITHPERMIDFCQWLAALEIIDEVAPGTYQALYSDTLKDAQLNTLLENELAAEIYKLADRLNDIWKGTPSNLLHELNDKAPYHALRSADWPKSPESLSKRLRTLSPALASQGVKIQFSKSRERYIEIITKHVEEMY